jgi:hypothetical protein
MQANEIMISAEMLRQINVDDAIDCFERNRYPDYYSEFNKLADQAKKLTNKSFLLFGVC